MTTSGELSVMAAGIPGMLVLPADSLDFPPMVRKQIILSLVGANAVKYAGLNAGSLDSPSMVELNSPLLQSI